MLRNGSDLTNEKTTKFISKNDIILIMVIALVAIIAFMAYRFGKKDGAYVEVRVDGKEYGTYSLSKDQEISIEGKDFVSTLVISDGEADMTQADCPDQICVKHNSISGDGETIVCLPHKVVVEVMDDGEKSTEGVDIISK